MQLLKSIQFIIALFVAVLFVSGGCAATGGGEVEPMEVSLLATWSGEYPVSELGRLPDGQQETVHGYIGDAGTFAPIWQVFMPDEMLPVIDFRKNIIIFTRNIQFYNRTSILKVMLKDSTAEIFAMETMSALPIEDKAAMAMALIPRKGVKAIQAGELKIEVVPSE